MILNIGGFLTKFSVPTPLLAGASRLLPEIMGAFDPPSTLATLQNMAALVQI
jgi:hypothetical protein